MAFGRRRTAEAELEPDELSRGELGRERASVMLVGVADRVRAVTRDVPGRQLRELRAEHAHRSCGRAVEPREDAQERRLARAARPEHRDRLAFADGQREALQCRGVSFRRLVHAEDVADLDCLAHVPTSAKRPATSARNARWVAIVTSSAPSPQ